MQNVTMATNQHFTATATPQDASANPGTTTFPPTWAATPTGLALTPDPTGVTCLVTSGTTPGTFTVTVTAQGAPETATFSSSFTVTIPENPATQFGAFSFTAPVAN